jgi:hypothetical protein
VRLGSGGGGLFRVSMKSEAACDFLVNGMFRAHNEEGSACLGEEKDASDEVPRCFDSSYRMMLSLPYEYMYEAEDNIFCNKIHVSSLTFYPNPSLLHTFCVHVHLRLCRYIHACMYTCMYMYS